MRLTHWQYIATVDYEFKPVPKIKYLGRTINENTVSKNHANIVISKLVWLLAYHIGTMSFNIYSQNSLLLNSFVKISIYSIYGASFWTVTIPSISHTIYIQHNSFSMFEIMRVLLFMSIAS